MDFPAHLKSWRVARGLSQAALAERAGIFRPNLIDLESGKRDCTLKTLERLARALEISPGRLLDSLPEAPAHLNRHQVDALARGLLKPETPLSPELEPLRELIGPLVFPILRAAGIEDPAKAKSRKRNMPLLRGKLDQQTLDQIVRRVSKLAAASL